MRLNMPIRSSHTRHSQRNLETRNHLQKFLNIFIKKENTSNFVYYVSFYVYKITIQNNDNQGKHSVECNDVNMQPTLKQLIAFLTKYSGK
jgi:hypothetical protein